MANEFIARNGLIALDNSTILSSLTVTGSLTVSSSLDISGSLRLTYSSSTPSVSQVIINPTLTSTTNFQSFRAVTINPTWNQGGFGNSTIYALEVYKNLRVFDENNGLQLTIDSNTVRANTSFKVGGFTIYNDNTIYYASTGMGFASNNTFRAGFTGLGNFLLGSNVDAGYKFYVSGSGPSGSLNVDNTLYVSPSRNVIIGRTSDNGVKVQVQGGVDMTGTMNSGNIGTGTIASLLIYTNNFQPNTGTLNINSSVNGFINFGHSPATLSAVDYFKFFPSNTIPGISTGSINLLLVNPTINQSTGTGTIYGYRFNPTNTAVLSNVYSFYADSGNAYFGGNVGINKITASAALDVSGSAVISGSFTVLTGSGVEFQVTNTGVNIGNIITDTHTVTGSLNISGSNTILGSLRAIGTTLAGGTTYDHNIIGRISIGTLYTGAGTEGMITINVAGNSNSNALSVINNSNNHLGGITTGGILFSGTYNFGGTWNPAGVGSRVGFDAGSRGVIVAQNVALLLQPYATNYTNQPVVVGNNLSRSEKFQVDGASYFSSGSILAAVAGNVLIGTTTDAGYKLDVNGTLRGTGVFSLTGAGQRHLISGGFQVPYLWVPASQGQISINNTSDTQNIWIIDNSGNVYNRGTLGVGILTPNSSAVVDITSTTKGFLPPRMTLAQRTAIASPAVGLTVYETGSASTEGMWLYESTGWQQVLTNTGSLNISGSVTIQDVLVLPYQNPLPSSKPTGSIALSGSGATFAGMFVYDGITWVKLSV